MKKCVGRASYRVVQSAIEATSSCSDYLAIQKYILCAAVHVGLAYMWMSSGCRC